MIEKITEENREKSNKFFLEKWYAMSMIIRGEIVDVTNLDGYIYTENEKIIGQVIYKYYGNICEIVSLNSDKENLGIGTKLLEQAESDAIKDSCIKIRLVTTNDNLNALKFFQKHGYHLTKVYSNSMENVRKIKKDVPLIGDNGIPLRDEIELKKEI